MDSAGWLVLTNWDATTRDDKFGNHGAWHALSTLWRRLHPSRELSGIEMAVYAITISQPFTLTYPADHSPVLYIGEGFAHSRFKEHLEAKLLPLLDVFAGAKFDFWVLPCEDKGQAQATEARMLAEFSAKYGAKPQFNVQSGKTVDSQPHPDWFEPLDGRRRGKREWAIRRLSG